MRIQPVPTGTMAGLGCLLVSLYAAIVWFGVWLAASLFQYSVWSIFRKDLPWYVDAIGGVLCNGLGPLVAFGCWIAQLLGYAAPFIKQ